MTNSLAHMISADRRLPISPFNLGFLSPPIDLSDQNTILNQEGKEIDEILEEVKNKY